MYIKLQRNNHENIIFYQIKLIQYIHYSNPLYLTNTDEL